MISFYYDTSHSLMYYIVISIIQKQNALHVRVLLR